MSKLEWVITEISICIILLHLKDIIAHLESRLAVINKPYKPGFNLPTVPNLVNMTRLLYNTG